MCGAGDLLLPQGCPTPGWVFEHKNREPPALYPFLVKSSVLFLTLTLFPMLGVD